MPVSALIFALFIRTSLHPQEFALTISEILSERFRWHWSFSRMWPICRFTISEVAFLKNKSTKIFRYPVVMEMHTGFSIYKQEQHIKSDSSY